MSDATEALLGELQVTTRLKYGSESLRLLFTDRRLIVDHMGKRGAGGVAGTTILGKLSSVFEDLFKSGSDSLSRRKTGKMSPTQVLRANRDNFEISYDEVVGVVVEQTTSLSRIEILTRDDKFEFLSRTQLDGIIEPFSKTLADKITVRRPVQGSAK